MLVYLQSTLYWVAQIKRNSRYSRFCRTLFWSTVIFFHLVDRASFPHYNNTKIIIKFGWEVCWFYEKFLYIQSMQFPVYRQNTNIGKYMYMLSFSGLCRYHARFPEFRGTINDSFSSTCANTYQHSTSYKEISVPMTCLDCKSLLGNAICKSMGNSRITEHNTRSIYGRPKLSLIVPRNSGNRANPENDSP